MYLLGIRFIEKMSETESFKAIGARLWNKHHPGCEDYKCRSDEYWRSYIRHHTLTTDHPAQLVKWDRKSTNVLL